MKIVTVKDLTIQFDDFSEYEGPEMAAHIRDVLRNINETLGAAIPDRDPAIVGVGLITEDDYEITEEN